MNSNKGVTPPHGIPPEITPDRVERAVNQIIRALRSGHTAILPGLGTLTPTTGKRWVFRQEP